MRADHPRTVLILSNSNDSHVAPVAHEIRALGGVPLLLEPHHLGQCEALSLGIGPTTPPAARFGAVEVTADSLCSVWFRRPLSPDCRYPGLNQESVEFVADQWRATLNGFYSMLSGALWVSHPDALVESNEKVRQLRLAQAVGLETPETLVTSDPVTARSFARSFSGNVVVKPLGRGWVSTGDSGGRSVRFVLTNRLHPTDLADLRGLRDAPAVFQEEIPKEYEVRANVVGQRVLAIRIESQRSERSKVDWRRYDLDRTPYTAYRLPESIEERCLRLTSRLGLQFGAIDLVRTPNGKYVFLEINGNGQFLWAEARSGVLVSRAMARLLCGLDQPLRTASTPS